MTRCWPPAYPCSETTTSSIGVYRELLARAPEQPKLWLSLGHSLRTAGRRDEAIDAYRRSLQFAPGLGESWWSLANLKTRRFEDAEIAAMERALAGAAGEDAFHLHYALGKALEDEGDWERSFRHYAEGARLRRLALPYDAEETTVAVDRSLALLQSGMFDAAGGAGQRGADLHPRPAAVGLDPAGADPGQPLARSRGRSSCPTSAASRGSWPPRATTASASPASRRRSADGLARPTSSASRSTAASAGRCSSTRCPTTGCTSRLIWAILPNATIIDARRAPMAAGFSCFKQHFARGQAFSYDLVDIGRYYRDYLRLMRGVEQRWPGRAHLAIYEDVVADTEGAVRRLLDHCGLPFEAACLNFHQTQRAVRTASSEQVRRPIFREGLDQWRHYAPWLAPLEGGLGEAVTDWRDR